MLRKTHRFVFFLAITTSPCVLGVAKPLVLDDFSTLTKLSGSPWQGGNLEDGIKDFLLKKEDGNQFLRSSYIPGNEAKYLYREVEWDAEKLPILSWRWRVHKLPKNAKVMEPKVSDAGAQVYVLWRHFPRYFVLKYFWATQDKLDATFKDGNVFTGWLFGRILKSGPPLGEWKTESRHVLEDFEAAFKQKPPGQVRAIAVLSDGDETSSPSEADFDDFIASASSPTDVK